jgi:hypothetical protein
MMNLVDYFESKREAFFDEKSPCIITFLECLSNLSCTGVKLEIIESSIMASLYKSLNTFMKGNTRKEILRILFNLTLGLSCVTDVEGTLTANLT